MKLNLEMKIVGLVVITMIIGSLCIGIMAVTFARSDVSGIIDTYSNTTISFIQHAIEETMMTGNTEVTRNLTRKKGSALGVESIMVLDAEGREAFSQTKTKVPSNEMEIIDRVKLNKNTFTEEGADSIVYYVPIINAERCTKCHSGQDQLRGILKVSMSIKDAKSRINDRLKTIIISMLFAVLIFGAVLLMIFKRSVIGPIKDLEHASKSLSQGDLSFKTNIASEDEIGFLNKHLKESIDNVSKIIHKVLKVSERVSRVSSEVEAESKKVIEGTQMEAESSERILASVEELDRSVGEINSSVEKVTTSAEEVTVAVDEMVTNTEQIAQNTVELSTAVDSTSSSIEEMSISIQEIAERTKELTVSSEDTLSAIEEINSAVREIDANTGESARLSEKVMTDASGFGMEAIVKTAEGMEKIKTSVQTTAQFIEVLSARSIQIGRILNVINEITDQTTLLALNAAILAAQAGEHGKGFSVVADEIKSLAERTTLSTQEIETLINSVQSEVVGASDAMYRGLNIVEEGTVLANDAKEALKKIIESAKKSTEMASSVQISTSEQAKAIKFVTDSMEKNKEMIGHIAKATSEQAKGVSLILSVSEKIRDITKQVKNANLEQAKGGKLIYNATENVTVQIHSISNAIKEQKLGSGEILNSLFKLKDMPEKVKKRAYIMNSTLRNLQKDSELLLTELGRFKIEHRKKEAGVINFGVMPLESPAEMYKRFIPLIDYLSIKLNKKIELYNAVDFVETVRNIGEGITDVSYMTPSTYIEARDKYNVEVLAKALNKGKPYHRCAIIAKDGGKINSIENLRGCSFAFGDKYSTSSYIVPRAMLSEAGIDIKDLSFYAFLGRHDDVANAVLNGEFEAGGVMETTAEKFRGRGIKIIKYSFEVPEFNICVNRALPDEEKRLIKRAFLDLNENNDEQRDILHAINPGYTGFVDSSDGDYEEIRNIMQRFKLR